MGSSELPPEGPLASKSDSSRHDRSTSSPRVGRAQAEKALMPQSWGTREMASLKGPVQLGFPSSRDPQLVGALVLRIYLLWL